MRSVDYMSLLYLLPVIGTYVGYSFVQILFIDAILREKEFEIEQVGSILLLKICKLNYTLSDSFVL